MKFGLDRIQAQPSIRGAFVTVCGDFLGQGGDASLAILDVGA